MSVGVNLPAEMFSAVTVEWSTPRNLFFFLDQEFHFTLDVCATAENAKCREYLTAEENALDRDWTGVCWCNPPYGRKLGRWLEKAYRSAQLGATVVCLIPSRTDTAWWHSYAMKAEIRFLRGRVDFGGPKTRRGRCPFPSALVIFRPPQPVLLPGRNRKGAAHQIGRQLELVTEHLANDSGFCAGMSYLDGVQDALRWVVGLSETPPIGPEAAAYLEDAKAVKSA